MEQQFKVGEHVWFTLGGKRHISKIVSFVPGIMGGGNSDGHRGR